jgi:hypothetical protein
MSYPFSVVSFVTRLGPATGVTWYILCTSIRMASRYGNLRQKDSRERIEVFTVVKIQVEVGL